MEIPYQRINSVDSHSEADIDFSFLPSDIVSEIFLYLDWKSRFAASVTCKAWQSVFHFPSLWHAFTFFFDKCDRTSEELIVPAKSVLEQHDVDLHHVTVKVNPKDRSGLVAVQELLGLMGAKEELILRSLSIQFTNYETDSTPLPQVRQALFDLFSVKSTLKSIDLSSFNVPLDDKLIRQLADNNRGLVSINILNKIAVSILSSESTLHLIQSCKHLESLSVPYVSLDISCFQALCLGDRARLRQLTIRCTRQDKNVPPIEPDAWKELCTLNPDLRVGLEYDETTLYEETENMLMPFLPVNKLSMLTYTRLHDQLNAVAAHYSDTLTHFDVAGQEGNLFDVSLINLVEKCSKLQRVVIRCNVDERVVSTLIKRHLLVKPGFSLLLHDKSWKLLVVTRESPLVEDILAKYP